MEHANSLSPLNVPPQANQTSIRRNGSQFAFCPQGSKRFELCWVHNLRGGAEKDEWTTSTEQPISQNENGGIDQPSQMTDEMETAVPESAHAGKHHTDRPALVSQVLAEMRGRLNDLDEGTSALKPDHASQSDGGNSDSERHVMDSESSEIGWGPGRGQMEACVTDEWDHIYPEHAERWKRTTYHDDDIPPQGYENEYVHANQSWKKYPPPVLASIRVLNAECGLNISLEPLPNTWDPDLYRPTTLCRPLRQVVREMQEERYLAREQRGLVPLRNRTREKLGKDLLKICRPCDDAVEQGDMLSCAGGGWADADKALELVRLGADLNQTDELERTALHLLCGGDAPERLISAVISAGACVNARDGLGRTALHAAVEFRGATRPRSSKVVALLLGHGAEAGAATGSGLTCVAAAEDALYYTVVHMGRASEAAAQAREVVRVVGGDESAGLRRWIEATQRAAERLLEKRRAGESEAGRGDQRGGYVPASMWADDSSSKE